jgi:hypothetical protein
VLLVHCYDLGSCVVVLKTTTEDMEQKWANPQSWNVWINGRNIMPLLPSVFTHRWMKADVVPCI